MDTLDKIRMILDEQTATIMELTAQRPLTASQISRELDLPHSVCYRKLKMLIDAQLLHEIRPASSSGGAPNAKRYTSNIDQAYVVLEHGELKCILKLRDNEAPQIFRIVE